MARGEDVLLVVAGVIREVVSLSMLRTKSSLRFHALPLMRQPSHDTVLSHASLCIAIIRSSSMVRSAFDQISKEVIRYPRT